MPYPAHVIPPKQTDYKTALYQEHELLHETDVPILTVAATYRNHLAHYFHESFPPGHQVVFSRAHYSMALGTLLESYIQGYDSWIADPTNYVTKHQWSKVLTTEFVAKTIARSPLLQKIKHRLDQTARNQLPITQAIQQPLNYLTENNDKVIVALHYEIGRVLAPMGKNVLQVVTDPHIRPQYLEPLPSLEEYNRGVTRDNLTYAVFDEDTKTELLEYADALEKIVQPSQVIVTGPPIDPRILEIGRRKRLSADPKPHRPMRLAITTGGLGTNKDEIKTILDQLTQYCYTDGKPCLQLFCYAGTHKDFDDMYHQYAADNNLEIGDLDDENAPFRLIHADNIVDANELLIKHVFPWADGFITKPSGDMAYDAAAANSFCFFLEPWGEWEQNIQKRFINLRIGTPLDVKNFRQELNHFHKHYWHHHSWYQQAYLSLKHLPKPFLEGNTNIVRLQRNLSES